MDVVSTFNQRHIWKFWKTLNVLVAKVNELSTLFSMYLLFCKFSLKAKNLHLDQILNFETLLRQALPNVTFSTLFPTMFSLLDWQRFPARLLRTKNRWRERQMNVKIDEERRSKQFGLPSKRLERKKDQKWDLK